MALGSVLASSVCSISGVFLKAVCFSHCCRDTLWHVCMAFSYTICFSSEIPSSLGAVRSDLYMFWHAQVDPQLPHLMTALSQAGGKTSSYSTCSTTQASLPIL
ncbi:hypothetical protein ABBQ38_007938 [Trebouxia sp. C0009 RCD-2024]